MYNKSDYTYTIKLQTSVKKPLHEYKFLTKITSEQTRHCFNNGAKAEICMRVVGPFDKYE